MKKILYHCVGGRSFRPLWALEELGLDYELKILPFPPRTAAPEYLAENPLGTIPLLIDGETRMRESVMIPHWLAVRAGSDLAVGPDETEGGRYLDMLAYGETTLTWPQAVTLLYGFFPLETERLPRVAADMRERLKVMFADLDTLLDAREWIAADRFTMADIAVGYALKLASFPAIAAYDALPARVKRYFGRLSERPAYLRALAVEGK